MPTKKPYAFVFGHGLAKNPAPGKLEKIWQWALMRDDPKGDIFPNPNTSRFRANGLNGRKEFPFHNQGCRKQE